MPSLAIDKAIEKLDVLVGEKLQVITFKAVSRLFNLPANIAKQVLFEYTEKRQDKVSAVYCLTGWTKGADPREVVQLVAAEQLAARRAELQPIRGMHVFSVQPRIPKDPAEIYEPDKAAFDDEMQRLVKGGGDSWLADNRFSAVRASAVKRGTAAAPPANQTEASPAAPGQPVPKPEPPPAQKKVGVEPVAVFKQEEAGLSGMVSKGGKKEADGQQDAAADAVQASSGASGSLAAKGSDSVKRKSPQGKAKGSLASMWSKVPAKKAKAVKKEPEPEKPDRKPTAQVISDDDDDDEEEADDIQILNAVNRHRRLQMDDDDEGTGAEEVDTKRQSTRGSRGRVIVLDDDDEEDEEESAEAAPAGKEEVEANKENHAKHSRTAKAAAEEGVRPRAQKRKTGNKTAEGAPGKSRAQKAPKDESKGEDGGDEEPRNAEKAAKAQSKSGSIAAAFAKQPSKGPASHPNPRGPGRWVEKTYYNDQGHEVTELVFEEHGGQAELKGSSPGSTPSLPVIDKKPAKESDSSAGGPKAAEAVQKKAAPAGKQQQRGIASFFGKK